MSRLAVFLLICWAGVVAAQDSQSARSLRLLYVQAPEDARASVFLVSGEGAKEIDLPRLSISSKRMALTAGNVRVFAATKAPTKAQPLPADAPFVDIPKGMNDPLVVLLPTGGAGPLAFRMLPLDFARTKAPEGSVVWLNLSTHTLISQLGSSRATIAPRRSVIQMPSGKTGDVYPVSVVLAPEHGEIEGLPLMKSSWVKEPGQRHLLVVVPDPNRSVPRIIDIPERMEPAREAVKDAKDQNKGASALKNPGK
jgi:hypothetical protein